MTFRCQHCNLILSSIGLKRGPHPVVTEKWEEEEGAAMFELLHCNFCGKPVGEFIKYTTTGARAMVAKEDGA